MTSRRFIAAGIAASAALFLGACSASDDAPETETTAAEAPADTAAPDDRRAGDDPVFAAIATTLAEHGDGIVTHVDREDDGEAYDVDVVTGNEVLELTVDADGAVREEERESGDDDVAKAQDASVTAADAIRGALDQHPDGVLDEAELDEDNGDLHWKIELDDADRNDLAELEVPAN